MTHSTSIIRLLVQLSVAYTLLGALGLMSAIPPGYASPVFPAAGLALACALWFGNRALPGIWLGSALLNLGHVFMDGHLSTATAAVALVIASASMAQAWAGSWMVNRRLGSAWRSLEREQDVFGFLFLGGVLACILSASISVTGLSAAGIIEPEELLFTWWNWYVGDTMGVLVFAPLTLCLLSRGNGLWRERRRRIVIPMLLTLLLAMLAFFGAARWERQVQENQLRADGETIAKQITDRLITHREVLSSLRHFIEATPEFTFRQFEQFTRITLHDNPDIFALSFNDLVTHEQRPQFERLMSRVSPLGPFRITERDASKRLVGAAQRPEYVAVRYIVPLASNQPAVGYDINSEPVRREAIERARTSGSMAVTAPIRLVQEQKQRVGVLELLPVEGTSAPGNGKRPRLSGFAVAVVKVDEMVEIATRGRVPAGLVFQLTDPHAPEEQGILYHSQRQGASPAPPGRAATWKAGLRMGDREWELTVLTTESYRQHHRPWLAWVVGVAGLMFSALLQILMLGMTGRTAIIQGQNEALKASEERYQQLFNNSPLPMWLYEAGNRRFLMVNDRAVSHYGWPRKTFLTMTQPDLLPPGDRPTGIRDAESCQEVTGGTIECRHMRQDGSLIDVIVHCSPARFGDLDARLEVVQDITLEKMSQAQLLLKDQALMQSEKMASIGQLAAGVAHEINNPMGYISSNLRTLAGYFERFITYDRILRRQDEVVLPELTPEAIAAVRASLDLEYIFDDGVNLITESLAGAERVTNIVRDLKSFSRVNELDNETVELNSCLESALSIVYNELKYVATIRKEYLPVAKVVGNPGQLTQVFLNILVNAGQSIVPPGEIALKCWQDDHSVYVSISDTGEGIPPENRDRIFDPFFTTKEVGKGTGLGLSISYDIVKKHQGEILVESAVGRGTTFTIKLPRVPEPTV